LAYSDYVRFRNLRGMSRLFDKFKQDILGILYLGAGFFIGISLATYNPQDPSLLDMRLRSLMLVATWEAS
jgi:hypothetical protein